MVTAYKHALDNVTWGAMTGPQAHLAQIRGRAGRFPADVVPFTGIADPGDPAAYADLAGLMGPGVECSLAGNVTAPAGWVELGVDPGVQMLGAEVAGEWADGVLPLGPADVPEMIDLAARTDPGPFGSRTIELGTYLGARRGGALVAMAGERMRLTGWTEISAVCTDPLHRGQGLASTLVRALVASIRERGDVPFLHAVAGNSRAIRLYSSMGFELRTETRFTRLRSPE